MHRSSGAIGAIAGALAKAQIELSNPEKSLVASIRSPLHSEGDRTFRYAPLSSGLDIVRKSLGKHEIATVQTTIIDQDVGIVRLCTVLAHASGEWISSDWPVCPINEMGSPRRMGAALTYARRYALFALVGIAGEDDLDAPDLPAPVLNEVAPTGSRPAQTNGHARGPEKQTGSSPRKYSPSPPKPLLDAEASAALRDTLIADLASIGATDELMGWARRSLPLKNTLTTADARTVEDAFQGMKAVADNSGPEVSTNTEKQPSGILSANETNQSELQGLPEKLGRIDKSTLAIPTLKRHRNKAHLQFVASQACLVCGRQPSDPHHLRFAQPRGIGLKVSDEFTVPLCRVHHRQVHQTAKERDWWSGLSIDALKSASGLWQKSVAWRNGRGAEPQRQ